MKTITTHVLDTSAGRPAGGIPVLLERHDDRSGWQSIGEGITDTDGRLTRLLPEDQAFVPGLYRLTFDVDAYFTQRNVDSFFPRVTISFAVKDPQQHYHVPLLLSPFGYSTYRGS